MLIETALMCLALNTYHEAKNQSMIGQVATAQVVMNRVADSRYPNTVCEVVKQGPKYKGSDVPVRHKCQLAGSAMAKVMNQEKIVKSGLKQRSMQE